MNFGLGCRPGNARVSSGAGRLKFIISCGSKKKSGFGFDEEEDDLHKQKKGFGFGDDEDKGLKKPGFGFDKEEKADIGHKKKGFGFDDEEEEENLNKKGFGFNQEKDIPDRFPSKKMDGSKKAESGIGILLNARTDGSGAIICELNGKNQYRVRKFVNGQWDILSFAGDNGWNRDKAIKNKSFNEMVVKCNNGIFDFYINSIFIFSFTDKKLTSGNIGVYANGNSSGKIDYIKIFAKNIATPSDTNLIKTESPYITPPSESSISDNEVVLLLKSKIDKQQKKITELTKEIEKCKLQKSGDTSLEKVNIELVKQNESLFIEKGKLEIELRQAKETITEYELLKKQLESNDNGDIILTLNNFINREKRKNQELQQKLILLQTENNQLKDSLKELQKEKK